MENIYYVYEWIRLDTNEPFYIGKGKSGRCYNLTRQNNNHFNNIVKSIPTAVVILEDNLYEQESYEVESWYIYEYRDVIGYDLTNITDGGDGVTLVGENNPMYGRPWWDENTPQSKIDEWKAKVVHYGKDNGNYGRQYTEQQIDKMRQAKRGMYIGKENPNYGNDTLKKKFELNPELKKFQARHGSQNGNSKKIRMIKSDGTQINFDYMSLCATWLIDNGYTNAKIKGIVDNITVSIKRNKLYLGFRFEIL